MKKILSLVLAVAMLLSISAVALAEDPITLKYSEVNPETSFVGTLGAAFKAKVEELSGGQIHHRRLLLRHAGHRSADSGRPAGRRHERRYSAHLGLRTDQLRLHQVHAAVHPLHVCQPPAFLEFRQQRSGQGIPQPAAGAGYPAARPVLRRRGLPPLLLPHRRRS